MNKAPGQKPVTVAIISSQDMACPCIACSRRDFPSTPESYTYMEQVYQIIPISVNAAQDEIRAEDKLSPAKIPQAKNTRQCKKTCPRSLPDVILLAWDARYLEQGLRLLSAVTSHSQVKDNSIPVIFCLTSCCQLKPLGISIDFQLLEDVLQIPVIPCFSPASSTDDVKAAIAYAGKRRFSYYCLDFSPQKLTDETVRFRKNGFPPEKNTFSSGKSCLPLNKKISDKGFSHPALETAVFLFFLFALFYPAFALILLFAQGLLAASLQAEAFIMSGLLALRLPPWLSDCLVCGIFRALACVVSIMLPPLALSLPLMIFLEESGLISRLSFLGDSFMGACGGCGKQCFAMTMGIHCHMAGLPVCGSLKGKKERLSARLANTLLPCGGRIPALLILFTLILIMEGGSAAKAFPASNPFGGKALVYFSALFLPGFLAALACAFLLSCTISRKLPSFFMLELLPLHRPRLKPVMFSAWSCGCFLLGKAGTAAIFAGLFIWFLGHIIIREASLLTHFTLFLEPFARLFGLDGVILAAFFLGIPANELTWPLILLLYLSQENLAASVSVRLSAFSSAQELAALLSANGWSRSTALSVFFLTLFHCPCLPSLTALRRESQSAWQTAAAALIPTFLGLGLCLLTNIICR